MTAWTAYSDPLCVSIDQGIAGQNYPDNRMIWHGLADITFAAGGISGAQWFKDSGPLGMDAAFLEPRAFCTKGTAGFSFTGRTLIVRLNVAWSWFTGAVVTIDAVAPSTLGLLTAKDTLSCDAATYQMSGDGFVDVVVADGLTDTAHTCLITINSPSVAKFFSIVGFKVGTFASQPIQRSSAWLVPASALLQQNMTTVTITNRGSGTVTNVSFGFPAEFFVDGGGNPLITLTADTLGPDESTAQTLLPAFAGDEVSGQYSYSFPLSAEYPDTDGIISNTITVAVTVGNIALSVNGSWFQDAGTPTNQARLFTTDPTATLEFTFVGDALTMTVQTSAGWGVMGIYASNGTTLLNSITCNADTGGQLATSTLTGFGAGSHTVILHKTVTDGLFIVFVAASWSVTENFTEIAETVIINYLANQPVAMPVQSVSFGAYDATFAAPSPGHDYSGTPVRQNDDVKYTEVLSRQPTFAVCYQSGFSDILAQYDIVIVDPLAVHAADVLAWQANGIKVFGYISTGEEVGSYQNRYDFSSPLAPNAGDGPGGFAAYYMYTQHPVSGPPDKDGVWSSYFVNPDPAYGWPERIETYYAPQVLGGPLTVTDEVVTCQTATITSGSVIVFDTLQSPIDSDEAITLKTFDGVTTYTTYRDYTFNPKTGAFVLSGTISPAVTNGQQLKISYTRKGHRMDGVFFDTVDTVDVYGSDQFGFELVPGYADNFIDLVNNFADAHSDAWIISNRGFTILPSIIKSCKGVMFESWLTLPTNLDDLANTDYLRITDPDTVAGNETWNVLLRSLRMTHEFDVYSLNYCHSDSRGDDLRVYCRSVDASHGYLSWQATITLDTPGANTSLILPSILSPIPGEPINAFIRYKTKGV